MLRRASVVALLFAIGLAPGAVSAQTAPPDAYAPYAYVDTTGVNHGTLTVKSLIDPFTAFAPNQPAPDGSHYALLRVRFEAADEQSFEAQPYQILLQDTDGYTYSPNYVPRPEDATKKFPDFQGQTMNPGDVVSGMIGYVLPDTAKVDNILYTPDYYRVIELADVLKQPGPAQGTKVTYVADDGSSVDLTTTVTDPFTEFDPNYPPDAASRFVGLNVVAENPGQVPYGESPYYIVLRDTDGNVYQQGNISRPQKVTVPILEQQTMAPGDRVSGIVGFVVPAAAKLAGAYYQPESNRFVELADFTGAAQAGEPPAQPSPGEVAPGATAEPPAPSPSAGTAQ